MAFGIAVAGGSVLCTDFVGEGMPASRHITARRNDKSNASFGETRNCLMAWADIDALLAECFPAAPALPGRHPTVAYLYVESVDITPWPPIPPQADLTIGTVVNYVAATAAITYSTLPYDTSDFITRRKNASIEVVLLPTHDWRWEATPPEAITTPDVPLGKHVPIIDHVFDYHRVPASKEAAIDAAARSLIGRVNRSTWRNASAQTVYFAGYESVWTIDSLGNKTFTFSFQFRERRLKFENQTFGWNHFPRLEGSGPTKWQRIMDLSRNYVYPLTDDTSGSDLNFEPLFQ